MRGGGRGGDDGEVVDDGVLCRAGIARRSRARWRSSSGVDGDDVLLPEKTQKLVKMMREVKIGQK